MYVKGKKETKLAKEKKKFLQNGLRSNSSINCFNNYSSFKFHCQKDTKLMCNLYFKNSNLFKTNSIIIIEKTVIRLNKRTSPLVSLNIIYMYLVFCLFKVATKTRHLIPSLVLFVLIIACPDNCFAWTNKTTYIVQAALYDVRMNCLRWLWSRGDPG